MRASKLMRLEITTVPSELKVEQAHRLMHKLGIRHLPVVWESKLAGMVSDRDILLASTVDERGKIVYPQRTVGEVMTVSPIVAGPDASVPDLAKRMVESKIDALPIVSSNNELLGLVTTTDLMLLLTELPEASNPTLSYEIRRVEPSARA